ncbi:condensation domain-containing protein [Actinophytocola oryzae]|uniref:Ketoacyl-synthetase-like protein n=1 Tax=Actinophytocola oryzae TaxID=502181 RepID=A0A4R7W3T6_9PSEU|nr:condensation domain-containing protein [Actinophytocola oryzae]TDV56267.1 ketoacyl-synthetase-like protein [Actinophytocola oryzae]
MPSSPPIAIVGVAAALPGAGDDLAALAELLDARRDLVAPVPANRRADGGLDQAAALAECALLDRIDEFDHAFFGLSAREAGEMDPQQRLLLSLSCKAIWDSGHPLAAFAGTRTAVVFGAASENYSTLLETGMVTGSLPAAQAGRVAHTLDLRGPAMTVDTACSSALAAVLEACRRLATGEADWALTGGVRLLPVPPAATPPGAEGIVSPTGRSRSFDAAADGTGLGEGGAVFLLKPLVRAEADGDPVHAVILGGATNHDGGRSNGFAAPSTEAQEELLLDAWRAAGINPGSLGLVEAHGTGTRLGDPIEFQALSAAFARRTERTGFCVLGSVKSNIGHLDSAAGAAGLLKAVVSVGTGARYASAHFVTPNPLLDTENSALRLPTGTESWTGPGPRRAGVSAFGLIGTNVHLVVEQPPPREPEPSSGLPLLVPVSARSEGALRRHAARLAAHLRRNPEAMADVAMVQAVGRDHEPWRATILAADAGEAVAALDKLADGTQPVATAPEAVPVVLLPHETPPGAERLIRTLLDAGVSDRVLIGHGAGNHLVDILRGEADPSATPPTEATPLDPTRLAAAFGSLAQQGTPVCVAPWPGALTNLASDLAPVHVLDAALPPREALLDLLAALYRAGVPLDWARSAAALGGYGRRASVPTALFEPIRCWVTGPQPEQGVLADEGTRSERVLAAIWCELLGTPTVNREDDFFELGGDSLMQTQLDNAVEREFGVTVELTDIFDYPRLCDLAAHIDSLTPRERTGPRHDPARTTAPATHSQRRMWLLQQLDPKSGLYNVSTAFELSGPVDARAVHRALDTIAARHAILRTQLIHEDGELTQRVDPSAGFEFAVRSFDGDPTTDLRDHAAEPFDLAEPGAARALLLRDCADPAHSLLQLVLHHAICDEWSMNLLLDELAAEYTAQLRQVPAAITEPALQFTDWAAWEHERGTDDDADYWRTRLAGVPVDLPLPTDFPYGARQDDHGAWLPVDVPAELVARAREEARKAGGTLFTWLLTAYAAWLARLTQSEDFLIGVPVAGRQHASAERLLGCFVNTVPVRVDATGDPGFATLFERVRDSLNGALAHQAYPFDLMVDNTGATRDAARPPLVQTLLSLQGDRNNAERLLDEVRLRPLRVDAEISWFDLSAVLWDAPDGGLGGVVAYRTALFEPDSIKGFLRDWLALAAAGLDRQDESIHTLLEEPW